MIEDDEEYIDSDLDVDLDGEEYLEDDQILVSEEEAESIADEEFIYNKLERRKSPFAKRIVGNSLTDEIVANESGGDYRAMNPNSSAVGKYQFLWNTWGNKISEMTGVKSKEEFKNNPQAQDDFYNEYYVPREMMPAVKRLKKLAPDLNDKQLAKLYHYQGEGGAAKYLRGEVGDIQQSYNSPISKYTGIKRQVGGITPLATNFKMPTIDSNYALALTDEQRNTRSNIDNNIDFEGIGNNVMKGINTVKKIGSDVAQGLSTAIDIGEQFTSEQVKNNQYRKMMQRLYGDNPSNYAPSTQRVNNNSII